jgi:translation initiation factor 2-alpha kinase 4
MYSLGIIFFEMCFLFRTQMERVQILSSLRQPSISFPPAWKPDFRPKQRKLIEVLLQHDPEKRPTAHELLTDDELMPQPEKIHAYTQEAIAGACAPCLLWSTCRSMLM